MQDFFASVAELVGPWFPEPGEGYSWILFGILFAFFLVAFFVIRIFFCWFFKLNEISRHLKKIEKLLEEKKDAGNENVQVIK